MRWVADLAQFDGEKGRDALVAVLLALLASAILVESDVYRYVTIGLVTFVAIRHKAEFKQVSSDWLALLCYVWATYVLVRFALGIVVYGEKGASEWLYVFPAFFPAMGAVLYTMRQNIYQAAVLLVMGGLIALIATLDPALTLTGERATPLFHHNPIHAGVGSCMLFISAAYLLLYALETGRLSTRWKWPTIGLCVTTAIMSLAGILGAQSKGAWLALAATMSLVALLCLLYLPRTWRILTLSAVIFAAVTAVISSSSIIDKVAGSTIASTEQLTSALASTSLTDAMQKAIEAPATPEAMRERLMIWYNALELYDASPVFGLGNEWLHEWHQTTYQEVKYTLLHNGYLEILVRHGLLGFAFLGSFAVVAMSRLVKAQKEGVIARSTLAYILTISFFFFWSMATNSNNRLAIGESFFILSGAAVFAVTLLRKNAVSLPPRA